MADNVTVTPAASNIAFASGSTTHVTLSGNVSDSTSAYVGNIYVHGDQFDNTGFVIQNTKTGGGNQRSVIILAAEDGSIIRGQGGTTLGSMGADLGYINFEKTRNVKISEYADNGFLYLASGGNIGINTNAPSYELTLADKFMWDGNHWRANQTNGASMRNEVPSATNPVFTFNNDVDTGMGRAAADELSLITAGTEAIRINSSQKVGIGTAAPTEALHVYSPDTGNQLGLYSDANEVSALNFYENTTKSAELLFDPSANDLKLINRISGGDMIFRVENNTEAMRILNDGKVVVGSKSIHTITAPVALPATSIQTFCLLESPLS